MHFHYFLWFSNIFLIFLISNKHEQISWFQIMELIEPIHVKVIWTLVGGMIFLTFFSTLIQIRWLLDILIDIYPPYANWDCFTLVIGLILFSIEALMFANQVYLLHPTFQNSMNMHVFVIHIYVWFHPWFPRCRILWICMLLWSISMFDSILGCLDVVFYEYACYCDPYLCLISSLGA